MASFSHGRKLNRIFGIVMALILGLGTCSGCGTSVPSLQDNLEGAVDDNFRNYYEIFVGSFYDSNGDGIGDINGVTEKLDYITGLGCNGIWLSPMMDAPSYHKYDTRDYYLVDPKFGTNEDFEKLTKACHDKGVRIIIDMVVNHSSSEHPWFTEACDYLRKLPKGADPDLNECPYVDYYNFSREQKDSSYREVSGSDWYYEAVFDYSQPDLNLHNDKVKEELYNIASFWMKLGTDGFRMDAAMHYDDSDTDFNLAFLEDFYSYCKSINPQFYMVSEVWAPQSTIAVYYESQTPSFFNFDAADAEGKLIKAGRGTLGAEGFVRAMEAYQETFQAINPDYIDAPFITNHDMGRVANALMSDPTSLKMTAGLLLTMQGSPFIYYGEEIGMKSKGKADENKRLHMNWSLSDQTGICDDPANADKTIEQTFMPVDEQLKDENSILNFYKQALSIRNANPEIARGEMTIVESATADKIAVIRKDWNSSEIYIAYNNGEEEGRIDMETLGADTTLKVVGSLKARDNLLSGETAVLPDTGELVLQPKSIVFLK